MAARNSLARRKARRLLAEAGVARPPVPVEELAGFLGATLRFEPFGGELSGMVHRRAGRRPVIGVNSNDPPARMRFTIAHELGHLVLHEDEELHIDEKFPIKFRDEVSSRAVDAEEIEANQFAAELLMPVKLLTREIATFPDDMAAEEAVVELARRFEVSEQAMTFRLTGLQWIR